MAKVKKMAIGGEAPGGYSDRNLPPPSAIGRKPVATPAKLAPAPRVQLGKPTPIKSGPPQTGGLMQGIGSAVGGMGGLGSVMGGMSPVMGGMGGMGPVMGGRTPMVGAKPGGMAVKNFGMKKGGSVSASRRADGIAAKGKTRGRMC